MPLCVTSIGPKPPRFDVEVSDTEVGAEVVGNLIEEGHPVFLPGTDRLVEAVSGLKIPANPLLIRILLFLCTASERTRCRRDPHHDRLNADPVLADEIEVNHIAQHPIVMLHDPVEPPVRTALTPLWNP